GPQVEGVAPVEQVLPADPLIVAWQVAPRGPSGLHGWPVALLLSDLEERLEQEPNDEIAKANQLPVPGAVTGRFQAHEDRDFYQFTAKKGQKLNIEVQTLELGTPTLVYLTVRGDKGAELAKSNPQAAHPADQRLEFTAPGDGTYFIEV